MAATKKGSGAKGRAGDRSQPRETVGLGAYFLSLTVENVRCFGERQELRLTDAEGRPARCTVLLGENGVGKTTLLQALVTVAPARIDAAQVSESTHWSLWPWGSGPLEGWAGPNLPRGSTPFANRSPISRVRARIALASAIAEPGLDVTMGYGIKGLSFPHVTRECGDATGSPIGLQGGSTASHNPLERVFLAAYGPYRRLSQTSLVERDEGRAFGLNAFDTLFDSNATLPNAEEWYLQRDYEAIKTQNPTAARQRDRVRKVLLRVLPGVTDLTVGFREPGSGKARLLAETADGAVPVSDLGLGYQSVLAWVVDLASRLFTAFPDSPDPLVEPCVVLVDEIDIHLHPRWQRTLLADISAIFPNAQFIVTAHSPLIVQAATDANLAVLRRVGDHVEIDQSASSVRNWRVDQILTSDLFGLPSARPAALDDALALRDAILAKDTLTPRDEADLVTLRERIGALPGGETPLAMEAEEILRRAAKEVAGKKKAPRKRTVARARARRV